MIGQVAWMIAGAHLGTFLVLALEQSHGVQKKQDTLALPSSKAEYMAATLACCQIVWLRKLLADLQQQQIGLTEIWCDNKATISRIK